MKATSFVDRTILLFEYNYYLNEDETVPSPPEEEQNLTPEEEDGPSQEEDFSFENDPPTEGDPNVEMGGKVPEEAGVGLGEEEVEEIDITALVEKQDALAAQFAELKDAVKNMSGVAGNMEEKLSTGFESIKSYFSKEFGGQVEELKKELIVRNPTPKEDLGLRTLSSYPYNVKVADYFSDYYTDKKKAKEDLALAQQASPQKEEKKEEDEFVITRNAMSQFSDIDIKNSF